jgi:hypothetical protein
MTVTSRSPYVRNISVITSGTVTSPADPRGYDTGDAGRGAYIDGSVVDPSSKAKEILKNSKDSKEADFLSNILNKVETNVNPSANPMEAVSSIMSSGVFTDLISGMNDGIQDGSLDLGKLMGTVQQMCSSFGGIDINKMSAQNDGSSNPPIDPMSMLSSMMGSMKKGENGGPDLSGLTSLLGPMLANMANTQNNPSTLAGNDSSNIKEI